MHKLLARQLRRHFGDVEGAPPALVPFLEVIEGTYIQADEDRAMLEHSMETVSEELMQRNRQLREEQARYRMLADDRSLGSIFDHASVGMQVLDLRGKILHTNRALQRLLGYSGEELRDRSASTLSAPGDADALHRGLARVVGGGSESAELEKRYIHREGHEVAGWLTLALVRSDSGEPLYVMGLIQDVSERNRMREALRESEDQLRQAQKMEAVGQLAGGVAHDFNNLLTVIKAHSAFLLESLDPGGEEHADARRILEAGERAEALTRQLLAFSRKQILQPRVIDLNDVVDGVAPLLRRLIGEDIAVETATQDGIGAVVADRGQVEQAIINLAVNARDAMPGGGRIVLSTRAVELAEPSPPVPGGSYVELSVRDNGTGIEEGIRNRIFEPFFTTKEPGKGTGLGLAMIYGFVKQSGGYLLLDSELGVGSEFRVLLPRVLDAVPLEPLAPAPAARGGSGTILLVEDEATVRAVAARLLERAGYDVLPAEDGEVALRLWEGRSGPVDVVLTDVVMPGISGRVLVERLRAADPGIGVVYMSGYMDDEVVLSGLVEDDASYVAKPFDGPTLVSAVAVELARRAGVGEPP